MHLKTRFAVLVGALALLLTPTAALAGVEYETEAPKPHPTTGPNASMAQKTKAYGVYCRGFAKKRVAGEAMTPFSRCVTAMARAAVGGTPRSACHGFSKAHVKGQSGTPYARCVAAATKVKQKQRS